MAEALSPGAGCLPSLPPPSPKSPPKYPDLSGKHREMNKVQRLEREIGFLQAEIRSIEDLQPASRCCKEVADFVASNSDPLMPNKHQKNQTLCSLWNWLCLVPCLKLSCLCCCCHSQCVCHFKCSRCCGCSGKNAWGCDSCMECPKPSLKLYSSPKCDCCRTIACDRNCCVFRFPSCTECCCCGCQCSCLRPRCLKACCDCCNRKTLCCGSCRLLR